MDLQKSKDWTDLLLKSMSIVAIVIAGVWAYYQHWITETTAPNVQIVVTTEFQQYGEDTRLLLIHVKPKNIGKVRVTPGRSGFVISVRSIPEKLKAGIVDLESFPVLYSENLLKRFPDGYDLEPGVEYDEILAMIVPRRSLFTIKASLDLGDNAEVDHTTVTRVE